MGQVICIANQKGGVGKTTTAINLCASLAVAERSCLLIDCDPQGNATTGLGSDPSQLPRGTYDLLMGDVSPQDLILKTELGTLHLIGASGNLIGAEVELAGMANKEFLLRQALERVRADYDFVVVDCPPSLGFLTINALTAADAVLVPLQCEYYALEGLAQILRTVHLVKKALNPVLKILGILLTMFDRRNSLSHQVVSEVRDHFKGTVFETMIPRNVRLGEAPSHGKPALLYDIRSAGAQSYLALAQELLGRGT